MKQSTHRIAAGILATGALAAAPAVAGATTSPASSRANVVTVIKAQDKLAAANPEVKQIAHFKVRNLSEARAAVPKLKALGRILDHAADAVAHASATSAQKAGQRDWVAGARDEAAGIKDLGTFVADVIKKDTAGAKSMAIKANKELAAGDALGKKADRLLKLPKGA